MRITHQTMARDLMRNLGRQAEAMNRIQNQMGRNERILKPRDNPMASQMVMFYKGKLKELDRYVGNIDEGVSRLNFLDSSLQEVNKYLQEVRGKALQGANGILGEDDRRNLGIEVEQFLKQIILIANSKLRGESVFGGFKMGKGAYRVEYEGGRGVEGLGGGGLIGRVEYEGDIGSKYREISRGEYMRVNGIGNKIFWVTNQRIKSQTESTGYIAYNNGANKKPYQKINIDGKIIRIDNGDNLQVIVSKINNAGLEIKAEIDNTTGEDFMILQTTRPHELWLEDIEGGQILQDLGIIADGGNYAPGNIQPSAIVQGDSLFDHLIKLRDSFLRNDLNGINRSIGGLDQGMENIREELVSIGVRQNRLEEVKKRISQNLVYTNEIYSKFQAIDMTKAITDLKNIELSHQAALKIGSKIIRPTLLDFLN